MKTQISPNVLDPVWVEITTRNDQNAPYQFCVFKKVEKSFFGKHDAQQTFKNRNHSIFFTFLSVDRERSDRSDSSKSWGGVMSTQASKIEHQAKRDRKTVESRRPMVRGYQNRIDSKNKTSH